MSDVYHEMLRSLNEAVDFESGKKAGTKVHRIHIAPVKRFTPSEIKKVRNDCAMTQQVFALCIGVTKKAVEAWEGGRSEPDGAARRLIGLMQRNPGFAKEMGLYSLEEIDP